MATFEKEDSFSLPLFQNMEKGIFDSVNFLPKIFHDTRQDDLFFSYPSRCSVKKISKDRQRLVFDLFTKMRSSDPLPPLSALELEILELFPRALCL